LDRIKSNFVTIKSHTDKEEGSIMWLLEVSVPLTAEEGDQVFINLIPGRLENPDLESGSVGNELYD